MYVCMILPHHALHNKFFLLVNRLAVNSEAALAFVLSKKA